MDQRHTFFIAQIAESAIRGNTEKALGYLRQLVENLERDGDMESANRLKRVIERKPARTASATRGNGTSGSRIPVDSESAFDIAERSLLSPDDVFVVLSDQNRGAVSDFVDIVRESGRLQAAGVGTNSTMLLYGPPGTGKTLVARHISAQLGLPLITARTDGLISSYLGSTAKNVRRLFDYARREPCVLFLDEFDAVAKKRDDRAELGELKRVVISLLQNIDSFEGEHVLIAATNHEHLLDPAIWRRFAFRIEMDLPDSAGRAELLNRFFGDFLPKGVAESLEPIASGLSGAQIRIGVERCIRRAILSHQDLCTATDAAQSLLAEGGVSVASRDDIIEHLHKVNPRHFTQTRLESMFGVSQPYISKMLKKRQAHAQ